MASGEPTRDFSSRSIKKDEKKKVVLSYNLPGFKPSNASHSCIATVSTKNELVVEASMESKKYQDVISNIGVPDNKVAAKGSGNTVEVHITKPDSGYSIQSKFIVIRVSSK